MLSALQSEVQKRLENLLSGVKAYVTHPVLPARLTPDVTHIAGSSRLLRYGHGARGTAVLCVPSLINKYTILDLTPASSLMRYLAHSGFEPYVLDWGSPEHAEWDFTSTDYICERLIPAAEMVRRITGKKILLLGYCMGGLMCLAAAQLRPDLFSGLALLATPWDFHASGVKRIVLNASQKETLHRLVSLTPTVSAAVIQGLFMMQNPFSFEHKFRHLGANPKDTKTLEKFIALEEWVNDGVPMARGMAQECFIEWAQDNTPMQGAWKVAGRCIQPENITLPCFVAAPRHDAIVPLACARSLAKLLPHAEYITPSSGHVGMVVGTTAHKELWQPLIRWMENVGK